MKIIKTENKKADIQFSNHEISALKQILNELCNGIKVENFEKKIGTSKQRARKLLSYISNLKKCMTPESLVIHKTSSSDLKVTNEKVRKKICLKSEKYSLFFYIRKLDFSNDKAGLVIALCENITNNVIAKTNAEVVFIEELQNKLIYFRNKISSFSPNLLKDLVFCSFLNEAVNITVKRDELDSSSLIINFDFQSNNHNKVHSKYMNFTTKTTLNNISNFIELVNHFLISIKNSL